MSRDESEKRVRFPASCLTRSQWRQSTRTETTMTLPCLSQAHAVHLEQLPLPCKAVRGDDRHQLAEPQAQLVLCRLAGNYHLVRAWKAAGAM